MSLKIKDLIERAARTLFNTRVASGAMTYPRSWDSLSEAAKEIYRREVNDTVAVVVHATLAEVEKMGQVAYQNCVNTAAGCGSSGMRALWTNRGDSLKQFTQDIDWMNHEIALQFCAVIESEGA